MVVDGFDPVKATDNALPWTAGLLNATGNSTHPVAFPAGLFPTGSDIVAVSQVPTTAPAAGTLFSGRDMSAPVLTPRRHYIHRHHISAAPYPPPRRCRR